MLRIELLSDIRVEYREELFLIADSWLLPTNEGLAQLLYHSAGIFSTTKLFAAEDTPHAVNSDASDGGTILAVRRSGLGGQQAGLA